jgi:hypothetical protein
MPLLLMLFLAVKFSEKTEIFAIAESQIFWKEECDLFADQAML